MGLVLTLAGGAILGSLALALLLLCIPWVVSVVAATAPARRVRVDLRPFAGGFPAHFRLDRFGKSDGADRPSPERDSNAARSPRSGGAGGRRRRRALRMLRAAPQLLSGLLSAVRIEFLRVQGSLGLDDPADTGQLFGALLPLSFLLPPPRFLFELQPDFSGAALAGEAEARLRIHPIRLLPPAIRFGWRVFVRPA